jgi:hypothetical protein
MIWASFIEYGHSTWAKVVKRIAKEPRSRTKALGTFDQQWGQYPIICSRRNMTVT